MDVFTNIDWHPPLDDMIDNEFINLTRLERESAMYNILRGTHVDPLKDLHKENYHLITTEHINYCKKQAQEMIKGTASMTECDEVSNRTQRPQLQSTDGKLNSYVPGIFKKPFPFPRHSNLSVEEHALCLNVLLKFSRSEKPTAPTAKEINELQTYLKLQSTINQEQNEYLELAKSHWNGANINIVREDLINLKWQAKLKQLEKLHKHYNEVGAIAFNAEQQVHVNFVSTVLETGIIPKFELPIGHHRNKLNVNSLGIKKKYFFDAALKKENYIHDDINCNDLAIANNIDLVISSSGLKCLATNLNPTHNDTWILPITIKEFNSKKIIFIDKPLPNTAKTIIEKNTWIYKYILKDYMVRDNLKSINSLKNKKINSNDSSNIADTPEISNKKIGRNSQYNIYTIGACGASQNELMKNKIIKDYKILIRTKIDAIEELEDKMIGCVKLVPKLEHQTAIGAEAVTLEEAAKQWISLTFTPNTYVIRVRIDQPTSEYLQIEKRTATSINNELNRLYNIQGDNILILIYNIINNMLQMDSGNYLLRHTPINGAFANIYKATDSPCKNSINLDNIYCENVFRTIPITPWPVLDKTIPTPANKFFNRMPAMYYPKKIIQRSKKFKVNEQQQFKGTSAVQKRKKKKKKLGQMSKLNCDKSEVI